MDKSAHEDLLKLNVKLVEELRSTDDMLLHVIADMHEKLSGPLGDIMKNYSDIQAAGLQAPTPKDFLAGLALYFSGQYQHLVIKLLKPHGSEEEFMRRLGNLVSKDPMGIVAARFHEAGIGKKHKAEVEDIVNRLEGDKPCSS